MSGASVLDSAISADTRGAETPSAFATALAHVPMRRDGGLDEVARRQRDGGATCFRSLLHTWKGPPLDAGGDMVAKSATREFTSAR